MHRRPLACETASPGYCPHAATPAAWAMSPCRRTDGPEVRTRQTLRSALVPVRPPGGRETVAASGLPRSARGSVAVDRPYRHAVMAGTMDGCSRTTPFAHSTGRSACGCSPTCRSAAGLHPACTACGPPHQLLFGHRHLRPAEHLAGLGSRTGCRRRRGRLRGRHGRTDGHLRFDQCPARNVGRTCSPADRTPPQGPLGPVATSRMGPEGPIPGTASPRWGTGFAA